MTGDTHACARPGCGKELARGVFACGPHWHELPPPIRGRISQAWWAVLRGTDGALERHTTATTEAVEYWSANS